MENQMQMVNRMLGSIKCDVFISLVRTTEFPLKISTTKMKQMKK